MILEILTILTGDCCEIGGLHTRDCGDCCEIVGSHSRVSVDSYEIRGSHDGDWKLP